MFNLFKCKCPVHLLCVQKDETVEPQEWRKEVYGTERSIYVTYYLSCQLCCKKHKIEYARTEIDESVPHIMRRET